ncbi:phage tail protein [Kluyvera ascorbata]|uniref:phage tail protein n=1 Tax=Kluyvera ascorbata TaxID=51288 RepID=UPI0039F48F61
MTTKYFATLTNQGAARLANATALGIKLNITQMGVGDANGKLPTPSPTQTTLINQRRIAAINSLSVDDNDAGQIIAEQVIPENEGGFWIREIGLYDDTGVLIAVANCPETYKPLLTEGSGRTQTIRMILVVSSSASITLKVDPSVVLATRKYVDDGVVEVKSYVDKQVKEHEAKANPHAQYLMIENALKEIADAGLVDKALANLGLGDLVDALIKTNNLSDLPDKAVSRANLGAPAGIDKQMCTAWANWSNNGSSCTVNDAFGISSITRVSQGVCQVSFSAPLLNAKYSPYYNPGSGSDTVGGGSTTNKTQNSIHTVAWQGQGLGAGINFQRYDSPENNIHIYGGK